MKADIIPLCHPDRPKGVEGSHTTAPVLHFCGMRFLDYAIAPLGMTIEVKLG